MRLPDPNEAGAEGLAELIASLQKKLDSLLLKRELTLKEDSESEKAIIKSLHTYLADFLNAPNDSTINSRQRLSQRASLQSAVKQFEEMIDQIGEDKHLKLAQFAFMKSAFSTAPQILAEFKKVCSIRGSVLELSYKMLLATVSAAMDRLLCFVETNEREIWQQAKVVNCTIEKEIEKISAVIADSKKKEEGWKNDLNRSQKECHYLAKMIRRLALQNQRNVAFMRSIELEKGILANDLASLKLELSEKGYAPSKRSTSLRQAYQPTDPNYQKWLIIKSNIENQYQIRPNYMSEFEKDFASLVNSGLDTVNLQKVEIGQHVKETGTSTAELNTKVDKGTQRGGNLVEGGRKTVLADFCGQTQPKEILLASVSKDDLYTKSNKLDARYSLHYQLNQSPSLQTLLDEFLFGILAKPSPAVLLDFQRMIIEPQSFTVVNCELSRRIGQSLESIDNLRLRLNSLGDNLATLEKENRVLRENCSLYETQNDELTKKMEVMGKTIIELKARDGGLKMDFTGLDEINKREIAQLVAEFAFEVKEKLLDCAIKLETRRPSLKTLTDAKDGLTIKKTARNNQKLKEMFEQAIRPYTEYDPEDNDVISVDDEEDVNLVNEDSTPCTIFVVKMLNFIKECLSSKFAPIKALNKEQLKSNRQRAEIQGTIRSISQIIHLKKMAQKIRLTVMSHSPNFKTAYSITQEILQKTSMTPSMPLSSVLKLIAEIYVSILFELKLNIQNTTKAKYPMYFYAYNHLLSIHTVQKLAESKFKSFIETVLAMKVSHDQEVSAPERSSTKILLFSKFLSLDDK